MFQMKLRIYINNEKPMNIFKGVEEQNSFIWKINCYPLKINADILEEIFLEK